MRKKGTLHLIMCPWTHNNHFGLALFFGNFHFNNKNWIPSQISCMSIMYLADLTLLSSMPGLCLFFLTSTFIPSCRPETKNLMNSWASCCSTPLYWGYCLASARLKAVGVTWLCKEPMLEYLLVPVERGVRLFHNSFIN